MLPAALVWGVFMTPPELWRTSLLLGFDARIVGPEISARWNHKRREGSLLKVDIPLPLSVDVEVWPSAVNFRDDFQPPAWIGPVQDLWDDLDRLGTFLNDHDDIGPLTVWLVAVAVNPESCGPEGLSKWQRRVGEIRPADLLPSWTFLGYDVADEWLESGLTNRHFRPDEDPDVLRREWAGCLNEHHLFAQLEPAERFARTSDSRSREHAPFCVFGIWRIGEKQMGDPAGRSISETRRKRVESELGRRWWKLGPS